MQKLLLAFIGLMLVGCGAKGLDLEVTQLPDGREKVATVSLGEACNINVAPKVFCEEGLECQIDLEAPEADGVCIAKDIKEMECDNTQDPVCGLKGNNKNGYLNACQAERHGALVLHQGFCKVNLEVEGNCNARLNSLGNCNTIIEGFEFDPATKNCERVKALGCEGEVPFQTLEACEAVCQ